MITLPKSVYVIRSLLIALAFLPILSHAQDDPPKNWQLTGYLKDMQTLLFFNGSYPAIQNGSFALVDTFLLDNLVHNRLNFRWYISDQFTFRAELRTRIFYGDLVKASPDFAGLVDNVNNDYFDLSLVLLDENAAVIHSMLDRLSLQWVKGDWEVTAGRQRINWGISSVWNPNDIFNAFSFTDFDYEERPGSDALRIRRYTGFSSSIELASRFFTDFDEAVIAGKYQFNQWTYDIQLLGGYAREDLVFGLGFAGNLGDAGLKGEATYFLALPDSLYEHNGKPARDAFAATLGLDYTFARGYYLNLGYLYNSMGSTSTNIARLFAFELSAKNLYPYRHAIFLQGTKQITPLLFAGLALIYSPVEVHGLFLNPTLTYNVATNWDLDLIGQFGFDRENRRYRSPIQSVFFRIKWSF